MHAVPAADRRPLRLLVVDDHFMARHGLRRMAAVAGDMDVVAEARSGAEALPLYEAHRPDVVIMDLRMRAFDGVQATAAITAADPDAQVLVLSSYDTASDVERARRAGARGFVQKEAEAEHIVEAVREVARGRAYLPPGLRQALEQDAVALSRRERQILDLTSQGLSRMAIARKLGLKMGTINFYMSGLMKKLGVHKMAAAVFEARKRGWLS